MRIYRLVLTLLILGVVPLAAQETPPAEREPGLYMTLETTMGSITCKLFEKEAPVTVRAIVGLALGTRPYLDVQTGERITGKPFYNGMKFFRVIPDYMIVTGDPLGTGRGSAVGPGFPFKDEFQPLLTFDNPGRLAMANAGRPNTNTSHFFITEVLTPHLDPCLEDEGCDRGGQQVKKGYGHTIFGQCENLDVVQAIARVPADARNRPRTPVVIKRVLIERVGPVPEDAPEAPPAPPKAPAKAPTKAPAKKSP